METLQLPSLVLLTDIDQLRTCIETSTTNFTIVVYGPILLASAHLQDSHHLGVLLPIVTGKLVDVFEIQDSPNLLIDVYQRKTN